MKSLGDGSRTAGLVGRAVPRVGRCRTFDERQRSSVCGAGPVARGRRGVATTMLRETEQRTRGGW